MRFYSPAKKCELDSPWIGPYLIVSFMGWTIGIQKAPESPAPIIVWDVYKVIGRDRYMSEYTTVYFWCILRDLT